MSGHHGRLQPVACGVYGQGAGEAALPENRALHEPQVATVRNHHPNRFGERDLVLMDFGLGGAASHEAAQRPKTLNLWH